MKRQRNRNATVEETLAIPDPMHEFHIEIHGARITITGDKENSEVTSSKHSIGGGPGWARTSDPRIMSPLL